MGRCGRLTTTGGGGVTLRRVGFLRRDSACSDKSLILRGGLAHYRLDKSLRPSLESSNFSSTILESQIEIRKQPKFHCEQIAPQNAVFSSKILESQSGKKNKHKLPNPIASDSKLESSFLSSLRADNGGEAIHKNKAQKVDSSSTILQSIALESKTLSLRALAQDKAWQSIHSTHSKPTESKRHKLHTSTYSLHTNLESTFDKTQMDCHAIATALARNDRENAQTSEKAESVFDKNAARRQDFSKETSANAERCPLF